MSERQYQLLEATDCPREALSLAWKQFNDLLGYRHSEWQRQNLVFSGASKWGAQWETYRAIQCGLYGTIEQNTEFIREWTEKGLKECAEDKDWEMFKEVRKMSKTYYRPERELWKILYPQGNRDVWLGRK
jgi:hypothetical protein